jgi:hypothetical protein
MATLTRDEVTALVVAGFPDLESKRLGSVGKEDVVGVAAGQQIVAPGAPFDGSRARCHRQRNPPSSHH